MYLFKKYKESIQYNINSNVCYASISTELGTSNYIRTMFDFLSISIYSFLSVQLKLSS